LVLIGPPSQNTDQHAQVLVAHQRVRLGSWRYPRAEALYMKSQK